MHITHVHIRIHPEHVEAFKAATLLNAAKSVNEPGSRVSMSCSKPMTPRASS